VVTGARRRQAIWLGEDVGELGEQGLWKVIAGAGL